MKVFEFFKKSQEKVLDVQEKIEVIKAKIENGTIASLYETVKQEAVRCEPYKSNSTAKKIISMFYADYPEIPYISTNRRKDWIEKAANFPKTAVVQRSMMVRFANGLLPGHVYMLYWLKKHTNKRVPTYFEYKYGIDFENEKDFLYKNGFLDNMNKPTTKGERVIEEHGEVIENHAPKQDRSVENVSKLITEQLESLRRNGFTEYEFIANRDCCPTCAALNGKHFKISKTKIGVNAPPMHEGCKCSVCAYEDDEEFEKWLNSL